MMPAGAKRDVEALERQRLVRDAKIRALFAQGYERTVIAERFGLNLSMIGRVLRGDA